jgi:GT2 family glycosyltransferase
MEEVMLSVIAVNHNSAALMKECISSIAKQLKSFEVLVIDSGSVSEDVSELSALESPNVTLILNKENIGYAKAVNIGLKRARGETLLITNPDVFYNPGSIEKMLAALSGLPRCGAVAPKTWWNKGMTFLLPFNENFTPFMTFRKEFMRFSGVLSSFVLMQWLKETMAYWRVEDCVELKMLSGACVMTARKVIERVGGFDETFPLYFEDTDWFLRVRKAGYSLYMEPKAQIIHYYNQSAKHDQKVSQDKFGRSFALFCMKHYRRQFSMLAWVLRFKKHVTDRIAGSYHDMGGFGSPPSFNFKNASGKLMLLSPVDSLIPSAGAFFDGDSLQLPEDLWERLGEGRYYVRVLELNGLRDCGLWTWVKKG